MPERVDATPTAGLQSRPNETPAYCVAGYSLPILTSVAITLQPSANTNAASPTHRNCRVDRRDGRQSGVGTGDTADTNAGELGWRRRGELTWRCGGGLGR